MRALIIRFSAATALLACIASQPSLADTYTEANFSGAISPGNANVQPPFTTAGFSGAPGDPITGSVIFDNNLVPNSTSGLQNVAIPSGSGFPSTAFDLTITARSNGATLNFNSGTAVSGDTPFIQYNDGVFNGFTYTSNFQFSGSEYQFSIQGADISIFQLVNGVPGGQQLLSAFINIGSGTLTGETPFTPTTVPLPPSAGLLGGALLCLVPLVWRRKGARQLGSDPGLTFAS